MELLKGWTDICEDVWTRLLDIPNPWETNKSGKTPLRLTVGRDDANTGFWLNLDDCNELRPAEFNIYFPTIQLAVAAANALACCTPENPNGRWV